jgi:hypothetical protein
LGTDDVTQFCTHATTPVGTPVIATSHAPRRLPVAAHLFDGYQVHRSALAYGLTVLALPRQVLLAGRHSAVPAAVSFTHGVPEASTMSAVTYAQDRRLRRALLERAGVPVPKGATFTWRSVRRAARWAAKEPGFPVVVKEVVGENPARMISGVGSAEELVSAFHALRLRKPEDRSPGKNPAIAGYAATRLGFQLDEDGNEVATPRTRFLVEKQLQGRYVRIFTCGDDAPAAVLLDRSTGIAEQDLTGGIHPTFEAMAVRAVQSVPGLASGTVDVVVEDPQKPADGQDAHVVEVSERPRAATYALPETDLGDRIGDALLEFQASRARLELAGKRNDITVDVRVEGLFNATAVAAGFPAEASRYGVEATVAVADDLEGIVTGTCRGTPSAVAALSESLMAGELLEDRASCIESRVRA